jgi:uncharacterized protein (DUF433 family)
MAQIEDYFNFLAPDDIRIKGTRIGIESILYQYIHRGQTAEEIAARFHTVSLEQVYATILYYFSNREHVEHYLEEWLAFVHAAREAQRLNPPPVVQRLRQLKTMQQSPMSEEKT